MTPASSGLLVPKLGRIKCSKSWTWVEGNFVFHLFSSSFLKKLILVKNNAEKMKQKKADKVYLGHGFVFLTYNPPVFVIPSCIFQRT